MTEIDGHEARRIRTREQILEAAEVLFCDNGYYNTSIADIAKAAGIGRRTFYLHFTDKDAVLHEMARQSIWQIQHKVVADSVDVNFRAKLAHAVQSIFTWVGDNLELAQVLMGKEGSAEVVHQMHQEMTNAFLAGMQTKAESLTDAVIDLPFIAQALTGIITQLLVVWVNDPDRDTPEVISNRVMTLLYDSLDKHYREV